MKYIRFIFLVPLLALLLSLPSYAQREFRPVDQAAQNPEFFAFRAQLQAAVARRDVEAVLAILHKNIKNSFGGYGGVQEFKEMWHPESPDTELWSTLATVLALGGSFGPNGSFTAPYVFSNWPSDLNGFEYAALVASSVRIRAQPSASSHIFGVRSFSILQLGDVKDWNAIWLPVRLEDGRIGHIDRRFVRSPIDYRAIFEKHEGRWQMTALVAGD